MFQFVMAISSENQNCSASIVKPTPRHLFQSGTPTLTSVDDGDPVSFILSTNAAPSNYRQLRGTDLSIVTSVRLTPSNDSVTLISTSSSSLVVQFPLRVGLNYSVSLFVGSTEYSASNSLGSTFSYQRNSPSFLSIARWF
jgi:hypothetical protein